MKSFLIALMLAAALAAQNPATDSGGTEPVSEQAFDIAQLDSAPPSAAPAAPRERLREHIGAVAAFDATFEVFLGDTPTTSFSSNHAYLLLRLSPSARVAFVGEILGLTFWELQAQVSRRLRLSAGKIQIPFTSRGYHHVLGGVTAKMLPDNSERHLLVPLAWAEYGLALRADLLERPSYTLKGALWLTNGLRGAAMHGNQTVDFTAGGGHDFDNNHDKAVGLRLDSRLFNCAALGLSFYTSKWAGGWQHESLSDIFGGDRVYLGCVDGEVGYGAVTLPFLRDLRFYGALAFLETESTAHGEGFDNRVPAHVKSATTLEVTYKGLRRLFDVRFRFGAYDDNHRIVNSRDLFNYNIALIAAPLEGLQVIPMYQWNRERVNETPDDFFFIKIALEL